MTTRCVVRPGRAFGPYSCSVKTINKPKSNKTVSTTVGQAYSSFGKEFNLAAGGTFVAGRRERHQLVMDSAGWPSLLLNGAAAPAFGSDFTFTSAQPINTERGSSREHAA